MISAVKSWEEPFGRAQRRVADQTISKDDLKLLRTPVQRSGVAGSIGKLSTANCACCDDTIPGFKRNSRQCLHEIPSNTRITLVAISTLESGFAATLRACNHWFECK